MVYRIQITVFFCLMLLESICQKPQLSFRNLDYRDGLPQSEFPEEIIEDHLGRIWIGYTNGLYFYDGMEIRHISARIGDSTALAENLIQCFYVDTNNRIWIGTQNTGISIYNPEIDKFSRLMPIDQGGPLPIPRVWDFLGDQDSLLWIVGEPGLVRHDLKIGTFQHFIYRDNSMTAVELEWINTFRSITKDPVNDNILWIGTRAGLISYSISENEFFRHPMPPSERREEYLNMDYMIMDMLFTTSYDLWCATWSGGLMQYNTYEDTWKLHREDEKPSNEQSVYHIDVKDDNTLWVATRKFFGTYYIPSRTFDFYKHDQGSSSSIAYNSVKRVTSQGKDFYLRTVFLEIQF